MQTTSAKRSGGLSQVPAAADAEFLLAVTQLRNLAYQVVIQVIDVLSYSQGRKEKKERKRNMSRSGHHPGANLNLTAPSASLSSAT